MTICMGSEDYKNLRVVMTYMTNPFVPCQGGGVRYVKNLAYECTNHDCEVLFLGAGGDKGSTDDMSFVPITKSSNPGYLHFLFLLIIKLPFLDLSSFHVVHVHRLYFAIPFLILKPKLKVVCTLHGRTFSVFSSKFGEAWLERVRWVFELIERFAIRSVHALVPVSNDVLWSFSDKYPELMHDFAWKTRIIGSMVDLSDFTPGSSTYFSELYARDSKYILFLGRLADVKDVQFLINIWSEKFQNQNKVHLVLVGDGELRSALEELASEKCTSNLPIFHGSVAPTRVPEIIRSAALVVVCSHHEASPTIVKESLACDVPVVSNDIGDVSDFIINGKSGYVVNKTIDDYCFAISKILSNPFPSGDVLKCSEDVLAQCTISGISKRYLELYYELVSQSMVS